MKTAKPRPIRVAVIEDDDTQRSTLQHWLESTQSATQIGQEVGWSFYPNGDELVKTSGKNKALDFDVVISDVVVGNGKGAKEIFEALENATRSSRDKVPLFIAITGQMQSDDARQLKQAIKNEPWAQLMNKPALLISASNSVAYNKAAALWLQFINDCVRRHGDKTARDALDKLLKPNLGLGILQDPIVLLRQQRTGGKVVFCVKGPQHTRSAIVQRFALSDGLHFEKIYESDSPDGTTVDRTSLFGYFDSEKREMVCGYLEKEGLVLIENIEKLSDEDQRRLSDAIKSKKFLPDWLGAGGSNVRDLRAYVVFGLDHTGQIPAALEKSIMLSDVVCIPELSDTDTEVLAQIIDEETKAQGGNVESATLEALKRYYGEHRDIDLVEQLTNIKHSVFLPGSLSAEVLGGILGIELGVPGRSLNDADARQGAVTVATQGAEDDPETWCKKVLAVFLNVFNCSSDLYPLPSLVATFSPNKFYKNEKSYRGKPANKFAELLLQNSAKLNGGPLQEIMSSVINYLKLKTDGSFEPGRRDEDEFEKIKKMVNANKNALQLPQIATSDIRTLRKPEPRWP